MSSALLPSVPLSQNGSQGSDFEMAETDMTEDTKNSLESLIKPCSVVLIREDFSRYMKTDVCAKEIQNSFDDQESSEETKSAMSEIENDICCKSKVIVQRIPALDLAQISALKGCYISDFSICRKKFARKDPRHHVTFKIESEPKTDKSVLNNPNSNFQNVKVSLHHDGIHKSLYLKNSKFSYNKISRSESRKHVALKAIGKQKSLKSIKKAKIFRRKDKISLTDHVKRKNLQIRNFNISHTKVAGKKSHNYAAFNEQNEFGYAHSIRNIQPGAINKEQSYKNDKVLSPKNSYSKKARLKSDLSSNYRGKGTRLYDMECIVKEIQNASASVLRILHYILYDAYGCTKTDVSLFQTKSTILRFQGFSFEKNTEMYLKKQKCLQRLPYPVLFSIYTILIGQKSIDRFDIVEELLKFLQTPSSDAYAKRKSSPFVKRSLADISRLSELPSEDPQDELPHEYRKSRKKVRKEKPVKKKSTQAVKCASDDMMRLKQLALLGPQPLVLLQKLGEDTIKKFTTKISQADASRLTEKSSQELHSSVLHQELNEQKVIQLSSETNMPKLSAPDDSSVSPTEDVSNSTSDVSKVSAPAVQENSIPYVKPAFICIGPGEKLRHLPFVKEKINKCPKRIINFLHSILYGRSGSDESHKWNILEFSGFSTQRGDNARALMLLHRLKELDILEICDIFSFPLKANTKNQTIQILLRFLKAPYVNKTMSASPAYVTTKSSKKKKFVEAENAVNAKYPRKEMSSTPEIQDNFEKKGANEKLHPKKHIPATISSSSLICEKTPETSVQAHKTSNISNYPAQLVYSSNFCDKSSKDILDLLNQVSSSSKPNHESETICSRSILENNATSKLISKPNYQSETICSRSILENNATSRPISTEQDLLDLVKDWKKGGGFSTSLKTDHLTETNGAKYIAKNISAARPTSPEIVFMKEKENSNSRCIKVIKVYRSPKQLSTISSVNTEKKIINNCVPSNFLTGKVNKETLLQHPKTTSKTSILPNSSLRGDMKNVNDNCVTVTRVKRPSITSSLITQNGTNNCVKSNYLQTNSDLTPKLCSQTKTNSKFTIIKGCGTRCQGDYALNEKTGVLHCCSISLKNDLLPSSLHTSKDNTPNSGYVNHPTESELEEKITAISRSNQTETVDSITKKVFDCYSGMDLGYRTGFITKRVSQFLQDVQNK